MPIRGWYESDWRTRLPLESTAAYPPTPVTRSSPEPASVLRERVTSKGGTTEAALKTMAEKGVKDGIVAGVHAAQASGVELGKLLGAA